MIFLVFGRLHDNFWSWIWSNLCPLEPPPIKKNFEETGKRGCQVWSLKKRWTLPLVGLLILVTLSAQHVFWWDEVLMKPILWMKGLISKLWPLEPQGEILYKLQMTINMWIYENWWDLGSFIVGFECWRSCFFGIHRRGKHKAFITSYWGNNSMSVSRRTCVYIMVLLSSWLDCHNYHNNKWKIAFTCRLHTNS